MTTDISGNVSDDDSGTKEVFCCFSFVGMETGGEGDGFQESGQVVMKEKSASWREVVITGYGQKQLVLQQALLLAWDKSVFANKATPTVDMLLQGQVAGVECDGGFGRPGEAAKVRNTGTDTIE